MTHASAPRRAIRLLLGLVGALAFAAGACSSSSEQPAASTDAGAEDGGGRCCPPAPAPGCCMDYGGWSENGKCAAICDGMPLPTDPGWSLQKDTHGCSHWTHPNDVGSSRPPGARYCGDIPPRDASADGDADPDAD